MRTVTKSRARA